MMMDPRQAEALFRSMGGKTEKIKASRVIIKSQNPFALVEPEILKVTIQGQTFYIISAKKEEAEPSEEELQLIMEGANVDREKAYELFRKAGGDVAKAIMMGEE
ncbi:MAG: hypothetical protein GXN92_02550 [Candidatus Micrarchaeota archaeon]|nr:hypothetical protein [Candidatus Micrarchaeota archaeon]